ncbi:hypothetical protein [Alicyclobacillus suci]|uniref:hypothetical protein n=1 Tax=Alicyclobacillus suci TaxID=2816080 RepID=UPI001A8E41CA|nr:hypothetical protein [Alicyclobacillus suci]
MTAAVGVSILILVAVWLLGEAKRTERRRVLTQTRQFFGNVVMLGKRTSYWQRYLDNLQTQLNRIGVTLPVRKYGKYAIVGLFMLVLFTHEVMRIPITISLTVAFLLLLFPRQIVGELSSRYVVKLRKRLLVDVIEPGMHVLKSSSLHELCQEIEQEAKSPVIRREFRYINELGRVPGMDVGKAMKIRAQTLGLKEFELLSTVTIEGSQWNARLTEVWAVIHKLLSEKVKTQNEIAASVSMYRMVAMGLFLAAVVAVVFAWPLMHVHGVAQVGFFILLVSYFVGISQVVKTKEV